MGNDNSALKETFILLKEIAQRILDIFGTIQTCRDLIILIVLMLFCLNISPSAPRTIGKSFGFCFIMNISVFTPV